MCCDGSLFGQVPLAPDEVPGARRNRLPVLDDGRGFRQPCPALARAEEGGVSCGVYDERPAACRRFACRLFERHRAEGGPLEARLALVRRARELLARLEASGLRGPEFAGERAGGSPAAEAYVELVLLMERDFARA
jgi:hypothetical protein